MKLIEKLNNFANSNNSNKNPIVIITTISEIREIFKPKEDLSTVDKIKYYIFNSVWNRLPNFGISSVLKDKLEYAIRIGSGISSYNQLPISWIVDENFKLENFLMKDRGHITTLVCSHYTTKFSIITFKQVIDKLIRECKSIDNWSADYSISHAVSILTDVQTYIKKLNEQQNNASTKKSERTLSIQMICENVQSFGKTLNNCEVSIEVRKESIYAHMWEILALNNTSNKWIEYQKAFLSFVGMVMQKDGSDSYFRNTLNIESIRNHIDKLKSFVGDSNITIFSSAISIYKRKVSEYSEIIPMRFLGLRKLTTFDKRGSYYYSSTQSDIEKQLMALHTNLVDEKYAKLELTLMGEIANNVVWNSYEEERKNLLGLQSDALDTKNLEDASLRKEDFGMACVDAVMELRESLPLIGDRTSENQINKLVTDFVNVLIKQMKEVVENESLFNVGATMDNRFQKLILPTYNKLKDSYASNSPKKDTKESIYETLFQEIKPLLRTAGQTQFEVIKFTAESYNEPQIVTIDFGATDRGSAGLDLGQKIQGIGYTIENCIIQEKYHNRSKNNVNHNVSNLEYWKWFSENNYDLVASNEKYFLKNGKYRVLADAKSLKNIFNSNN
jgi:hypothetical protein